MIDRAKQDKQKTDYRHGYGKAEADKYRNEKLAGHHLTCFDRIGAGMITLQFITNGDISADLIGYVVRHINLNFGLHRGLSP